MNHLYTDNDILSVKNDMKLWFDHFVMPIETGGHLRWMLKAVCEW